MINQAVSVTLQDAWLSGFTDAEGCFNVSIASNARYTLGSVIKMRYILDQKDSVILMAIQNLFGFGKVSLRSLYFFLFFLINNLIIILIAYYHYKKKGKNLGRCLSLHSYRFQINERCNILL